MASTAEKRALATAMGAEAVIDPGADDLKTRARELGGGGVDVVYDPVGGELAEAALRALRFDGRFLVVGFTAGIPRVPLNLVLLNNRTVVGVEWGGWALRNVDANRALLDDVLARIGRGELHPVAPEERPLEAAGSAVADLLERRGAARSCWCRSRALSRWVSSKWEAAGRRGARRPRTISASRCRDRRASSRGRCVRGHCRRRTSARVRCGRRASGTSGR